MDSHRFHKVSNFIETELTSGTFPGAALMIAQHGKTLFEHYWGKYCSPTQRENALNSGVTHMFYSFSKAISATVIVLAHQRKLIDYDTPINAYVPEYHGEGKSDTTIRHLLTHAAGIPNGQFTAAYSDEEWQHCLQVCFDGDVEWKPGSKTVYHWASGLLLAAEAVRRVMQGGSWETICRELLFDPMGAEGLTFQIPATEFIALSPQPEDHPCPIDSKHFGGLGHPGAGCFGQLQDIIDVLQLHLDGGVWKGQTIIHQEELREMHRIQYDSLISAAEKANRPPAHESWGLGWLIKRHQLNGWFGLGDTTSAQTFGHAGIDTVLSVADPHQNLAMAFITTDSPKPSGENTNRIRNTVTNLVVDALAR